MKHALITGSSRGLGAELARLLQARDFTVLNPPRTVMDVGDEISIMRTADAFTGTMGAIDVLINNAAVMTENPLESLRVNALGAYYVTKHFWPLLLAAKGARVINISSREGLSSNGGWRAYSVSKAALNGITRMQAQNTDGVSVNACCPGWFRSRMGGDRAPIGPAEAADTPVWLATEAPLELTGMFFINREVVPW